MTCADVRDWLRRDFDGVAEPSGDAAAHLERCDACRAEAGRLKAAAAAARAALPRADVPLDFTAEVMAALVDPLADRALVRAARARGRRWLPLLLVPFLAPLLLLVPRSRPAPAAEGDLVVEREGRWVPSERVRAGDLFGVPAGGRAREGALRVTAFGNALLRAGPPCDLQAGRVLLEASEAAVVRTPLAEIRLGAGAACVAEMGRNREETDMDWSKLKLGTPAVLAVTVLAGGVVVANDEGEEDAGAGGRIRVEPGRAPTLDELERQVEEAHRVLEEVRERMAELERVREEVERQRAVQGREGRRSNELAREVDGVPATPVPSRSPVFRPAGDPWQPIRGLGAIPAGLREPMTMHCEEAQLSVVLDRVANVAGLRFECVGDARKVVDGARITLTVRDAPAGQVLERALATFGLACRFAGNTAQILRRADAAPDAWPEPRDDDLDLLLARARAGDAAAQERLAKERDELHRRMAAIEQALLQGEKREYDERRAAIEEIERRRRTPAEVEELRRKVEEAREATQQEDLRARVADAMARLEALAREGETPGEDLRKQLAELRLRVYEELSRVRSRSERGLARRETVDDWETLFVRLADRIDALETKGTQPKDDETKGGRR